MKTLSWPTAAVLIVLTLAIAAIAIVGPLTGLDGDALRFTLGGTSIVGVLLAGVMRALFGADAGDDGESGGES